MLERYPVSGAAIEDFAVRELRLDGSLSMLADIRFQTSKTSSSFVNVLAQSRATSADEYPRIAAALGKAFHVFAPRKMRIWLSSDGRDLTGLGAESGDRLVVGYLPELLKRRRPGNLLMPRLERPCDLDWYADYAAIYEEHFAKNPEWKDRLRVEPKEVLETSLEEGGLFRIFVDDEFAGIIAAKIGEEWGIKGWLVVEITLAIRYRGRSLAPVALRLFLEELDQSKSRIVLGTIEQENVPSLRTALSVGR